MKNTSFNPQLHRLYSSGLTTSKGFLVVGDNCICRKEGLKVSSRISASDSDSGTSRNKKSRTSSRNNKQMFGSQNLCPSLFFTKLGRLNVSNF